MLSLTNMIDREKNSAVCEASDNAIPTKSSTGFYTLPKPTALYYVKEQYENYRKDYDNNSGKCYIKIGAKVRHIGTE